MRRVVETMRKNCEEAMSDRLSIYIHYILPTLPPLRRYRPNLLLNLYAIYARYGTINILLPFTDLLRNVRPYVTRPAFFSSHLQLRS